jgi:hypothetical protein
MADIATTEPEYFVAGDTVKWKKTFADYKASDGWVLSYALRGAGIVNLTAIASGDEHLVAITPATSAGYKKGTYSFGSYVTKGTDRYTVGSGYIEVKENLATATSFTDRLLTLQADVDAVNAFLGKNYSFASYAIGGRSLNKYSITELYTLRGRLQSELQNLKDAEKIRRGKGTSKLIRVRFN